MKLDSILKMDESGRWAAAVGARRSRRSFSAPPDAQTLSALEAVAKNLSDSDVVIKVLTGNSPVKADIGAGTDCFVVIGCKKGVPAAKAGYRGEAFMLECEAHGIGSCWAYASCDRRAAQKLLDDYKLDCVSPLGIPNDTPHHRDRLKPLTKLTGLSEEELAALEPWQKKALDFAHIAPSAMNLQPWRFIVGKDGIAVKPSGLLFAQHDCGIAALHLELGSMAEGKQITPCVL